MRQNTEKRKSAKSKHRKKVKTQKKQRRFTKSKHRKKVKTKKNCQTKTQKVNKNTKK